MKTNSGGYRYRVNFAASVISRGGTRTRSFDNCFENWDGDAVAVALYRRARKNERLRTNLWRYIDRRLCLQLAFQHRRRPTAFLESLSENLIEEARAQSAEFFASLDAPETVDNHKESAAA